MTDQNSTLTLISYEFPCPNTGIYIKSALYCNPEDVDNSLNKFRKQYGDKFKLVLVQKITFVGE